MNSLQILNDLEMPRASKRTSKGSEYFTPAIQEAVEALEVNQATVVPMADYKGKKAAYVKGTIRYYVLKHFEQKPEAERPTFQFAHLEAKKDAAGKVILEECIAIKCLTKPVKVEEAPADEAPATDTPE